MEGREWEGGVGSVAARATRDAPLHPITAISRPRLVIASSGEGRGGVY